jgi:protein-tyrosine phosphatase
MDMYVCMLWQSLKYHVQEMPFPDGGNPSDAIVSEWLSLFRHVFKTKEEPAIGVHCVAGLGR